MNEGIRVAPFEALVVDVTTFEGVSSKTGKPFRKWSVITPDGSEWQTFNGQLAQLAINLKGRNASMEGTIKQNGNFTNYYLEAIGPGSVTGSVTTPILPQAPVSPQEATPAPQAPAVSFVEFAAHHDATEARKNESIHRQVAAKVAGHISETASDFWANVTDLFNYFQTGTLPAAHVVASAYVSTVTTTTGPLTTPVTSHAVPLDAEYTHGDEDVPF